MQVNDTVRAVHTAGTIRRAFFATVLSVQPTLPEDIGTNGEPTLTLGFLDPAMLHMVGGIQFGNAFRRITTVRHVSHDEVQTSAAEYCWTDVLPNDGGLIMLPNLNMSDLEAPAAGAAEPEDTIGTIVYINHKNGLEVFHSENGYIVRVSSDRVESFSDLFSAQVFVDAQPATGMTDEEADAFTAQKIALAGTFLGAEQRIEGSPRDLLGHQMFGENSEEVAKARYEIHLQRQEALYTGVSDRGEAFGDERFAAVYKGATLWNYATREAAKAHLDGVVPPPQPSAADLDAHAAEDQAKADTAGKEIVVVDHGEGKGFSVMMGDEPAGDFETREQADFFIAQMEEQAKSVTTVPQAEAPAQQ